MEIDCKAEAAIRKGTGRLNGAVTDQAVLYGLLTNIRDLGLTLITVSLASNLLRTVRQRSLFGYNTVMGTELLATKLSIPPQRGEVVPRARLLGRLDQGLEHKLILVSAPAGFGKTTLVAQWTRERSFAAGWLALDAGDNDLVRFLNYLSAALQEAIPAIAAEVRPLLQSPHSPPAAEMLTALINQVVAASAPRPAAGEDAAPRPQFVLILDDYHLITAAEIHEAVSFLLEHQPACLHLVLITRADPPLPCLVSAARANYWNCARATCASPPLKRPSSCKR
ncbi:MAG TPA: AAA family ATPase [Anaerolineae bacterium]